MSNKTKDSILSIKDVHVKYGSIHALKGVNMEITKGDIIAILGSNGAGKSTMLKTISGLVRIDSGEMLYHGKSISNIATEKIAALGIAQSPEGRQVFANLTVEENLRVGAFTLKDKKKIRDNYERVYRYFGVLKERNNQIAGTLSGGEQQMLAIARALMASPELLLLDEPSLGLAPLIVKDIFHIVKEINEEGTTVLIVEQNALQTLKIADYAYVLELGKVSTHGEAKLLLQDHSLIESYLGGGH